MAGTSPAMTVSLKSTTDSALGDDATFSQTGGARIGSWNATIPYAVLSIHHDALRLSCFGQDYVFSKDNIIALTRYGRLFSIGLRIHHDVPLYPKFIVFWVSAVPMRARFARLKERLEAFGYQVTE
jgi:hypothetical protein